MYLYLSDDASMIINDIWDGIELSLYEHESVLSQIKTSEDQEEQNVTFAVDYDQNIINENLIDTEVPDDEENNRDLNSTTIITSDLLINQSSEISFISNHINHQSITKRDGINRVFFSLTLIFCNNQCCNPTTDISDVGNYAFH